MDLNPYCKIKTFPGSGTRAVVIVPRGFRRFQQPAVRYLVSETNHVASSLAWRTLTNATYFSAETRYAIMIVRDPGRLLIGKQKSKALDFLRPQLGLKLFFRMSNFEQQRTVGPSGLYVVFILRNREATTRKSDCLRQLLVVFTGRIYINAGTDSFTEAYKKGAPSSLNTSSNLFSKT